ncbi:hypothetical protein QBC37DRAFT_122794 [Rhypophila decipiens]|uniref:Uncharacterized protein n=1 Tax=Rhypophila decipiens TaxID=261697 RepID=A0AAN7BC13_9PEZI|nr:hypothetical protein QBC37DRAFT_122794 [Rhypophila decipiens]
MGLNLLDRIQAKIELFRLEQRYTRRRHRRSTFVSNAIYVDGEYIYNSPNTTGSSANTSRTNNSNSHIDTSVGSGISSPTSTASPTSPSESISKAQKRLNRWSSMPGFGSSSSGAGSRPSQGPTSPSSVSGNNDWRMGQPRRSFDMR